MFDVLAHSHKILKSIDYEALATSQSFYINLRAKSYFDQIKNIKSCLRRTSLYHLHSILFLWYEIMQIMGSFF